MASLSCHSILRIRINSSLPTSNRNNDSSSPSLQSTADPPNPSIPMKNPKSKVRPTRTLPTKRQQQKKLQQHINRSRIERAIGAGSYRDAEPPNSDQTNSGLDGLTPNSAGMLESPAEKKIRETGYWIANKAEGEFRSNGKTILMFVFQWVLPAYILSLFLAAGVIKLPFSLPLLDDLIL